MCFDKKQTTTARTRFTVPIVMGYKKKQKKKTSSGVKKAAWQKYVVVNQL